MLSGLKASSEPCLASIEHRVANFVSALCPKVAKASFHIVENKRFNPMLSLKHNSSYIREKTVCG